MKIKVLSISDSDKHFSPIIQEYSKRLGKSIEIIEVKPEKNGTREQIITKETDKIIAYLSSHKTTPAFLLSIQGKQYTTEEFSTMINKIWTGIFIIGGPYGCDEARLTPFIENTINFWRMTMPHGLIKCVLFEQLYRADMISQGRSYHY